MRLLDFIPISFFRWCDSTAIADWVRAGAPSHFGIIQSIHLMVLTVLVGTIVAVDVHLLGFGTRRPAAKVVRELEPWTWTALALMFLTGGFLFMSEPLRAARSGPFFLKMILLFVGITLQFGIYKYVTKPRATEGRTLHKVAACFSLVCWLGVVFSGRAIAYAQLLPFLRSGR